MSKRADKTDFDFLPLPTVPIKREGEKENEEIVQEQTTRMTIDVEFALMEKIKDYAYWQGYTQQQLAIEALEYFFKDKQVKSRPEIVKKRPKVGRKRKS